MRARKLLLTLTLSLSVTILTGLGAAECNAAPRKNKKKQETEKKDSVSVKNEYEKFFSGKHETASGLITLHKMKGKLYFELPVNLLEKDMLLGSTVTEISDNNNAIVGSKPTTPFHFKFSKADNNICMKAVEDFNVCADTVSGLWRSLRKSNIDAIFKTFKISVFNADSTAVVFDVTDLFAGNEKKFTPFDPLSSNLSGSFKRTESFQSDGSFVSEIKSFSDNVVVKSVLSYTYTISNGKSTPVKDAPLTAVMTRSIVLLDDQPYRPRITDSRIAIFPTTKIMYDAGKQRAKVVCYANRWRLEPSDPEAFKRGDKVEPVKPIVFYIDSDFPEKWKPYIREGVNQWSEVFEDLGFKNAVRAVDFPEDDSEFDPDNIKYSCVRYAPISVGNAMGPSWVDPRSGEIINASVYVYHDVIKLLNSWIFIQTSPADERARSMNIPDEIIGDGLRYVISHEIGHCLGFMHNMGASATFPVDSLRSPSFTRKYGTTPCIMDYARFNYVAQPGDGAKGVRMTPPRFGEYDRFLVKWSYTPLGETEDMWDEYKITSGWLRDASANPVLRYGKQQSEVIDPRSQSEDLGDDALKASAYGIANLKYIMSHLNEWVDNEDFDYSYRSAIYNGIIMQYFTYLGHVYANVGGIYLYEKHVGDHVEQFISVPGDRQKEAVKFLLDQISDLEWIDDPALMENFTIMGSPADMLQDMVMKMIIGSPEKVELSSSKATGKPYTVSECLDDIYDHVWGPTLKGRKLNASQMKMQKAFLKYIGNGASIPIGVMKSKSLHDDSGWMELQSGIRPLTVSCGCGDCMHPESAPVSGYGEPFVNYNIPQQYEGVYFGYVLKIQSLLKKAASHSDMETRLHYQLMLRNIEKALN